MHLYTTAVDGGQDVVLQLERERDARTGGGDKGEKKKKSVT